MNTVLLQSYKPINVPSWIEKCLASVETLAQQQGWTYQALDDALFDFLPRPVFDKINSHTAMMSDLARLIWARSTFVDNPEIGRVIWIDADVYVFSNRLINEDSHTPCAVGRQNWIQPGPNGGLKTFRQVHNAVLVFDRDTPHLDFLIHSIITMIDRMDQIASPQMYGPKLLTALHNIVGFDVVEPAGMASPLVLQDLANGGGPALDKLTKAHTEDVSALNLCSSYRNQTVDGVYCNDTLFDRAIDHLESQGTKPNS